MPPTVSVQEAARITGQHRTTIQRHIKHGKLSAHRDEAGNLLVDATELARVYGPFPPAPPLAPPAQPLAQLVPALAQPAPPLAQPSAQPEPAHPQQPAPLAPQNALLLIETLRCELDAAQEREEWLLAQNRAAQEQEKNLQAQLEKVRTQLEEALQTIRKMEFQQWGFKVMIFMAGIFILTFAWAKWRHFVWDTLRSFFFVFFPLE